MNRHQKQLEQQREVVEQLQREASVKRITTSMAIKDLQSFVANNQSEDYLLIGPANSKLNPYREKKSCALIKLCSDGLSL